MTVAFFSGQLRILEKYVICAATARFNVRKNGSSMVGWLVPLG